MKDNVFEGFIEGAVAMTASVVALYAGTTVGLRVREKLIRAKIDAMEEEEAVNNESSDIFND